MKRTIVIGAALLVGAPASARLTKKQVRELGEAVVIAGAVTTVTPADWKRRPLPERHCVPWITFPTAEAAVPEVTVIHVSASYSVGRSEGYLIVTTGAAAPAATFMKVATEVASWWGGTMLPANPTATEVGEPQSVGIGVPARAIFTWADTIAMLEAHYNLSGKAKVELRCADIPRWVIEAHPATFELRPVFGGLSGGQLHRLGEAIGGRQMDEHVPTGFAGGDRAFHLYRDLEGELHACPLQSGCDLSADPVLGDEVCVDHSGCVVVTVTSDDAQNIIWP